VDSVKIKAAMVSISRKVSSVSLLRVPLLRSGTGIGTVFVLSTSMYREEEMTLQTLHVRIANLTGYD
jgi:hypothetical protein